LCLRFSVLVFFRLLSSTFSLDPVFVRHLRFSGLWPRFNIFVSSALDILFYLFFAGYCILRPTVIIWVPVFLIFIFFYKYLLLQSSVLFCGVAESGTILWRPRTAGAYEYY
jgi:hypothetical protein